MDDYRSIRRVVKLWRNCDQDPVKFSKALPSVGFKEIGSGAFKIAFANKRLVLKLFCRKTGCTCCGSPLRIIGKGKFNGTYPYWGEGSGELTPHAWAHFVNSYPKKFRKFFAPTLYANRHFVIQRRYKLDDSDDWDEQWERCDRRCKHIAAQLRIADWRGNHIHLKDGQPVWFDCQPLAL